MSKDEVARFSNDVKNNPELQAEFKHTGTDMDAFVSLANEKGYDFSADDVKAHAAEKSGELSDEQLDQVAGGGVVVEVVGTTVVVEVTAVAT